MADEPKIKIKTTKIDSFVTKTTKDGAQAASGDASSQPDGGPIDSTPKPTNGTQTETPQPGTPGTTNQPNVNQAQPVQPNPNADKPDATAQQQPAAPGTYRGNYLDPTVAAAAKKKAEAKPHSAENEKAAQDAAGGIKNGGPNGAAAKVGTKTAEALGGQTGAKAAEAANAAKMAAELATDYASGNWGKMAADIWKNKKEILKLAGEALKKALLGLLNAGGCIWILIGLIIILILVAVLFGGPAMNAATGGLGKSYPVPAGKDDPNVKAVSALASQPAQNANGAPVGGIQNLVLNSTDQQFVASGQIDQRLVGLLKWLAPKHLSLGISHIISDYQNMNGESGSDSNTQITANVSAHKEGLAADIATIDFVYKTQEPDSACSSGGGVLGAIGSALSGSAGGGTFDIVYSGDNSHAPDLSTQLGGNAGEPASPDILNSQISQNIDSAQAGLDSVNQTAGTITTIDTSATTKQSTDLKKQLGDINTQTQAMTKNAADIQNKISQLQQYLADNAGKLSADQVAQIQKNITDLQTALANYLARIQAFTNQIQTLANSLNSNLAILQEAGIPTADIQSALDAVNANLGDINALTNTNFINKLGDLNTSLGTISDQITQILSPTADITATIGALGGGVGSVLGTVGANELLRLPCMAATPVTTPNTTWNNNPAIAIPIKVSWQDDKPGVQYVDPAAKDDCATHEQVMGPLVCSQVFRPEAQRKVNQTISEILQYPYDMKDKFYYRPSQIITFSDSRDVQPFSDILNDLYGDPRSSSLGLFSMDESWAQIHIAY